jgi:hypothetical protein
MSSRIAVVVGITLLFGVLGLLIPYLQRSRMNAAVAASRNNLREISLFAAHHATPIPGADPTRLLLEVPTATVVLADVPADQRLSWVPAILPSLDRKRNPSEQLLTEIRRDLPWDTEPNRNAGKVPLPVLICPTSPPPDADARTSYVGIAGVGSDAATLPLLPTVPPSPRAGAFRHDMPTPFDRISDGLSQTLLLGETADSPGPWLRGGTSTTRAFDTASEAKPLLGSGGQFGGCFPLVANFALCDGAVRGFTNQTTPEVLLKMATIAGAEDARPPE